MTRLAAEIFPAAEALQLERPFERFALVVRSGVGQPAARVGSALPQCQPAPDRPLRERARGSRRGDRAARALVLTARPRPRRDRDPAGRAGPASRSDRAARSRRGHRSRRRHVRIRHAAALPRPPARVHQGGQRGHARNRARPAPPRHPEVSVRAGGRVFVPTHRRGNRIGRGSRRLRLRRGGRRAGLFPGPPRRRPTLGLAGAGPLARLPEDASTPPHALEPETRLRSGRRRERRFRGPAGRLARRRVRLSDAVARQGGLRGRQGGGQRRPRQAPPRDPPGRPDSRHGPRRQPAGPRRARAGRALACRRPRRGNSTRTSRLPSPRRSSRRGVWTGSWLPAATPAGPTSATAASASAGKGPRSSCGGVDVRLSPWISSCSAPAAMRG